MMSRAMKDLGVEWIGAIPDNWNVLPISSCFKERNEKVSDYDYEPLSVTKQGIVKQLDTAAKSDAHDDRKKVCANDFVINSRSDRKQSCGVSPYDGSVSLINIVLENRRLYSGYAKYVLKNYGFAEEFYRWGTGIVADLWSTNWQRMKKISIPVPEVSEQEKIAHILDDKIPEIDNIVSKTKDSIEEYKKYKQAIITEAVTKGLNPDVAMKESGVEWLGKIPDAWKVYKLKYLIKNPLQYGANETGIPYTESMPRYVRITDIDTNNTLKNENMLSLEEDNAEPYLLSEDDILFARSGGTVGKTFLYKSKYGKCAFAGYLIRATIKDEYMAKFIYYFTLSSAYDLWKNGIFIQSTIQNIGADRYSNMKMSIPPTIGMQKEIVDYLDNKCSQIDKIIEKKQTFIMEMENYKKSLIYEYVTGKKEVSEEWQG